MAIWPWVPNICCDIWRFAGEMTSQRQVILSTIKERKLLCVNYNCFVFIIHACICYEDIIDSICCYCDNVSRKLSGGSNKIYDGSLHHFQYWDTDRFSLNTADII